MAIRHAADVTLSGESLACDENFAAAEAVGVAGVAVNGAGGGLVAPQLRAAGVVCLVNIAVGLLANLADCFAMAIRHAADVTLGGDGLACGEHIAAADAADIAGVAVNGAGGGLVVFKLRAAGVI